MASRQIVSVLVAVALLRGAVAADTNTRKRIDVRDVLSQRRVRHVAMAIELDRGALVVGRIGRIERTQFYVLDSTTGTEQSVRFADVRALTDSATGERFAVLSQGIGGVGHASWKVWVIAWAVAIGALIIWVYSTGLNRA